MSGATSARAVRDIVVRCSARRARCVGDHRLRDHRQPDATRFAERAGNRIWLSVQLLEIYSYGHTSQAAALAIIILITMAALMLVLGDDQSGPSRADVLSD